jgi:hypothetical protein
MHNSEASMLVNQLVTSLKIPKNDYFLVGKLSKSVLFQTSYCFKNIKNTKVCLN